MCRRTFRQNEKGQLYFDMNGHRERCIKVNAFVDEGIVPLVSALSEIDGLVTLESCEGDHGGQAAFVIFRMTNWRVSGEFLFDRLLPSLPPDLRAITDIRLQAFDVDTATASISVEAIAVNALAALVRSVSAAPVGSGPLVARNAHSDAVA